MVQFSYSNDLGPALLPTMGGKGHVYAGAFTAVKISGGVISPTLMPLGLAHQ